MPEAAPRADGCSGPASAPDRLLYLHGFRSSPRSFKAQRLQAWLAQHHSQAQWWCPQLPPSPREAAALIAAGTADWPDHGCAVLGSSLGGFYATWMAEQRPAWRWVVINPAVDPARDLAAYIGEQTAFHDPAERFFFQPAFIDELRALRVGPLRDPQRGLAIVAQGDEVLDWREMSARYADAKIRLVPGSDHALSDFDDHLPHLLQHLGLVP